MTEHIFHFAQTAGHTVVIESDLGRDQALDLAWDKLPGSLCHQCAGEYDMSGEWELDEKGQEDQ
jgi:hypothetical protein